MQEVIIADLLYSLIVVGFSAVSFIATTVPDNANC